MQYSVIGQDGNSYGPVDLATLRQWALEGRVLPTSLVTDHLSNQTQQANSISELQFSSGSAGGYSAAPPSYADYPRAGQAKPVTNQGTRLWGILIWLGIAVVASFFFSFWPVWITGWNIIDAVRAKARKDPKADLCLLFGIGGFILILIWTLLKRQLGGS